MIQFSSRGYLYAPNRNTRPMWKNIRMMKTLAPQRCIPRTSHPSVEVVRDVLDRLVRAVRVRLVVHRQDHAGDRLDEERGQRRRAERLEPVDVAGNLAEEEVLDSADRGPSAPRASRAGSSPPGSGASCCFFGCVVAISAAAESGRARTRARRRAGPGSESFCLWISRRAGAFAVDLRHAVAAEETRRPLRC